MLRYFQFILVAVVLVPACYSADYQMEVLSVSDMRLGKSVAVVFDCTFEQLSEASQFYVHLVQDEQLFFVHEQDSDGDSRRVGKPFREKIKFRLPQDIPAGAYTLDIGIYGNKPLTSNRYGFEIEGEQTGERKPYGFGLFEDRNGLTHHWYVNDANALIWNGQPYLPVGGMFSPRSLSEQPGDDMNEPVWRKDSVIIDLIGTAGVDDLYLNVGTGPSCHPTRMQRLFDYLEFWKIRYGMHLGENPGEGMAYLTGSHKARVAGITEAGFYQIENPDWQSGRFLLTTQFGELVSSGRAVKTENGIGAQIDWSSGTALDLTFVPQQKMNNYFWDGKYETYEKRVMEFLDDLDFGPGFRFFADPFSNEMFIDYDLLPDSEQYRKGFAAWLNSQYKDINELKESWAGKDIESFSQASSLLPMEVVSNASGEIGYLLDLSSEKVIEVDMSRSQAWEDVRQFRAVSAQVYCNRIAREIKKFADVPVVFNHLPQVDRFRINRSPRKGFDGIGMQSYGSGELLKLFCSSGAISEAGGSSKTMWTPAMETAQAAFRHQNPKIAYQDRFSMYRDFSTLLESGAKGIFVFGLYLGAPGPWQSSEIIRDPRQLEWMTTFSKILNSNADRIERYRPEYHYWYPERRKRDEVFARKQRSYKGLNGDWMAFLDDAGLEGLMKGGRWILPACEPNVETELLYVNLEDGPASLRWGEELEKTLVEGKQNVVYLGYRKDIGSIPYLDVYFTEQFATTRKGKQFQVLRPLGKCKILGKTEAGQVWNMKVGNLQIISLEVRDHVGWTPEGVEFENEEEGDFLTDELGVRFLKLGEALDGFTYEEEGSPVIFLWADKESLSLNIPLPWFSSVTLSHPDGTHVPMPKKKKMIDTFLAADEPLLVEHSEKGIEGPHYKSFKVRNELVIEGLAPKYLEKISKRGKSAEKNIIFIEGENSDSSDFNFNSLKGFPALNGGDFQLLESYEPSSSPDGYQTRYSFRAPTNGIYGIWVRERYLLFQSQCEWRVDDLIWQVMPAEAIPARTSSDIIWSPFNDEMEVFGWYKYGELPLRKGDHIIEFKVREPNPITGKFSKGIDVISVALERKTRMKKEQEYKPLINRLDNPSFEAGDGDSITGWIASKPKSGGFVERKRNLLGLERISRYGHYCVFMKGGEETEKSHPYVLSNPIPLQGGENCYMRAWVRADGTDDEGYVGVRFYDSKGEQIDSGSMRMGKTEGHYGLTSYMARAPLRAKFAAMQIGYRGKGELVVDDAEFYYTE